MKKLVKEALNFEKNQDPKKSLDIGKDSSYSHEQTLKEISEMGVRVDIDFNLGNRAKVLQNVNDLKIFIDKLVDFGVKPEDMELNNSDSICVKGYTVKDGNQVMFHCLTESDANIAAKTIERFMINTRDINIDISSMAPYIYIYKENKWLKNLKENRIEYEKIG